MIWALMQNYRFFFDLIGKLLAHPVVLELTIIPYTLYPAPSREEMPFEL